MVFISVNAVLRLLKRSMCVRGRTHSVVCCYRFARSAIVARIAKERKYDTQDCVMILGVCSVQPHCIELKLVHDLGCIPRFRS